MRRTAKGQMEGQMEGQMSHNQQTPPQSHLSPGGVKSREGGGHFLLMLLTGLHGSDWNVLHFLKFGSIEI